jgi:tetratricopeptide (TPR) repeat protein
MPDPNQLFEQLQEAEDDDQLATSRTIYEAILVEEPDHPAMLVLYAANLIELGDLNAAHNVLSRAKELVDEESLPGFLSQQAHLARAQGDLSTAEKFYREAHKLTPDDGENLLNAAQAAAGQNELQKAEYLLREATKIEGELEADAWFNLAGNLVSQQRYPEARTCYQKVITLDSENSLAEEWIADLDHRETIVSQLLAQ